MTDGLRDASMLELFRQETEAQTAVLTGGLLELERNPEDAAPLDACMRAAHSLKGAARILGLDAGVKLAHAMEDLLVAAQQGRLRLASSHVDALLRGTDLLSQLGAGSSIDAEAAGHSAMLQDLLQGGPEPAPLPPAPAPAPAAAAPRRAPAPQPGGGRERMLRVSAEALDRMLDIAAKSLVEFQQVEALQDSLARLKRLQQEAGRTLDACRSSAAAGGADSQAAAQLDETWRLLQAARQALQQHMAAFADFSWAGGRRSRELYDAALASRMRPFSDIAAGWERMVRDLAQGLGKRARLVRTGGTTQVDRDVLERLETPLVHLLRNAIDHGIEPPAERAARGKPAEGLLQLDARHHGGTLVVELRDDGAGIDLERLRATIAARGLAPHGMAARLEEDELLAFLSLPGFSMRDEVTDVSGRGIGLDAVQHELRALRGGLRLSHRPGQGCTFRLDVPLTLSVLRSLVVEIGGEAYAFPLSHIDRTVRLPLAEILHLEGRQFFRDGERHVDLLPAGQVLQRPVGNADPAGLAVVLIGGSERPHGIVVDRMLGEHRLAAIPLDPRLGKIRDVLAGAVLDDGRPVLILDVEDLTAGIERLLGSGRVEPVDRRPAAAAAPGKHILVVDDSLTVRELQRKLLAAHGYRVTVAVDGMDAWDRLRTERFDMLITDIDMPRMDGIELVTRLRSNNRLQSLPVMVVSYKDREEDRRRGLEAGADRYLAKAGFDDRALVDAVETLIGPARE